MPILQSPLLVVDYQETLGCSQLITKHPDTTGSVNRKKMLTTEYPRNLFPVHGFVNASWPTSLHERRSQEYVIYLVQCQHGCIPLMLIYTTHVMTDYTTLAPPDKPPSVKFALPFRLHSMYLPWTSAELHIKTCTSNLKFQSVYYVPNGTKHITTIIIIIMETTDILIVGAGPAGSALACFLGYHGKVSPRQGQSKK